ncbi:MATE family efflux transporter [Roseicyclus sp.]|uniref:MATE family efflux transporter n=1 Tax=Roseicyclus sp. TaxID=1914329 RepID=UPI003F6B6641
MTLSESERVAPGTRSVFDMAWPMMAKAMMLHGIVVIDTYLVSGLGEVALSAMGLAAAISGLVLGTILAFANAMQIRAAQAFGTGDAVFLRSTFAAGLATSLAVGVAGLCIILLAGRPLIGALAPSAEVAMLAFDYLSVFVLVILAEAVGQALTSFLNGCGNTRLPLYSYFVALPVNVGISVVLIHGLFGAPALGLVGAAVGSVLAALVQVGFLALRVRALSGAWRTARGWRNGGFAATWRRHLIFSLPIAATFISAVAATHVCALIYARLSLNEFAALTLILPWIVMAGTVGMSWAQATGIIVAQLLGQHRPPEVLERFLVGAWRAAFWAAALVAAVYLAVCVLANWLYPGLTLETRAIIASFLPILLLLPFPKGSNAICGNTLRASGDTVYVMHVFVWSQWLFKVPATALAVLYLNLPAVLVLSILLLDEFVKAPAFHLRLFRGDWKAREIPV